MPSVTTRAGPMVTCGRGDARQPLPVAAPAIAARSPSLTSSVNPIACVVRCSHCPGTRSIPGSPASRSRAAAARACTSGASGKVTCQ